MKVLIVDDSPVAVTIAKAHLVKEELEVCCTHSATDGLAAAQREKPDLILLDIDMPDMSGFEVCQAIKAVPDLAMIPIIFLTGSDNRQDRIKGLDLGAVDYVTKPFDAFELRARVRAALRTKRLQDLLVKRSLIDPLTELANRAGLTHRLGREWARRERYGGDLSLVMCDLDHFKQINDQHGHQVGDKVLYQVAQLMSEQCRESDLAARYGGEEFAIVVPEVAAVQTVNLAQRCRKAIENWSLDIKGDVVEMTASFGVADATGLGNVEALIEDADRALYQAKEAGRNRVELAGQLQNAK